MKKNNKHNIYIYISFGENCLTDRLLERYELKSFATPYSWGLSNVEYALQLERDQYKDFLNPQKMVYAEVNGQKKVRLNTYNDIKNKYEPICMNGFEFTHHDVLANQSMRESFQRRYLRLLEKNEGCINIFYHHRLCDATDREMLLEHLLELKKIYLNRASAVNVVMFTQVLVDDESKRKVEHNYINGVHVYTFYTLNKWAGNNMDIFWAKCDDDLMKIMFSDVQHGLTEGFIISRLKFIIKHKLFKEKITAF